jgi:hypothetical protein
VPDAQTINSVLNTYGLSGLAGGGGGINVGYWVANILFGIIGWCAFSYGRKEKNYRPVVIGLVLMVYPYFITNTILTFAVGFALTSALYFWRE